MIEVTLEIYLSQQVEPHLKAGAIFKNFSVALGEEYSADWMYAVGESESGEPLRMSIWFQRTLYDAAHNQQVNLRIVEVNRGTFGPLLTRSVKAEIHTIEA